MLGLLLFIGPKHPKSLINKYNSIAGFYSLLSRIVFGNDLIGVQEMTLAMDLPEKDLLILGGGNGDILPFLYKTCPQLDITFVDASSKMLHLAKGQKASDQKVEFIHTDQYQNDSTFQAILLPFFLDVLSENELKRHISAIKKMSDENTMIYLVDFYRPTGLVQKLKLKLSILFFKLFTSLAVDTLTPVFDIMENNGYKVLKDCRLQKDFIRGSILTLQ